MESARNQCDRQQDRRQGQPGQCGYEYGSHCVPPFGQMTSQFRTKIGYVAFPSTRTISCSVTDIRFATSLAHSKSSCMQV